MQRRSRSVRAAAAAVLLAALLTTGAVSTADAGTPVGAAPSGAALPKGSTKHWKQVVAEDFVRPARLGTFAERYPGWAGYDGRRDTSRLLGRPRATQGLWRSATTVSVHDGMLDCRLHTRARRPQLCAITPTATGRPWEGRRYGRYVVRFRADRTPGYKIAFLLWPESDDWTEGEIDFPEADLTGTMMGSAHAVGDPERMPVHVSTGTTMTGWHTATISWTPRRLTFRLDDRRWTTTKRSARPTTRMRWALQAESRLDARPPAASAVGRIEIDWVATYRWRG